MDQRPPRWVTVAFLMVTVPLAVRRSSLRVDSWVRTAPMIGSRTCRESMGRAPVVLPPVTLNRTGDSFFEAKRGNEIRGPDCLPVAELKYLFSASRDSYSAQR